ncbi:MAG: hypothetical protein FJ293_10620 [Planctomycetes bacterium]|nr:hypothetical protein [Planctomycetota bacterium]
MPRAGKESRGREEPPADPAGSLGRRFAPPDGRCEICGCTQLDRHCKVVCPSCGFMRDCSDP